MNLKAQSPTVLSDMEMMTLLNTAKHCLDDTDDTDDGYSTNGDDGYQYQSPEEVVDAVVCDLDDLEAIYDTIAQQRYLLGNELSRLNGMIRTMQRSFYFLFDMNFGHSQSKTKGGRTVRSGRDDGGDDGNDGVAGALPDEVRIGIETDFIQDLSDCEDSDQNKSNHQSSKESGIVLLPVHSSRSITPNLFQQERTGWSLLPPGDLVSLRNMGEYCSAPSTNRSIPQYKELLFLTALEQKREIEARLRMMDNATTKLGNILNLVFQSTEAVGLIDALEEQ